MKRYRTARIWDAAAAMLLLTLIMLAGFDRRTDHLIGLGLGGFTRSELLAEVDRTMRALESYPAVPTLPAADLTLPAFADMWEGA